MKGLLDGLRSMIGMWTIKKVKYKRSSLRVQIEDDADAIVWMARPMLSGVRKFQSLYGRPKDKIIHA